MTTIYVLLMVWSTSTSNGGVATLAQEFNSLETCEHARAAMAQAHNSYASVLRAHGCFKK